MELEEFLLLLVPYPAAEMEKYTVGTMVNSPANDVGECVRRLG